MKLSVPLLAVITAAMTLYTIFTPRHIWLQLLAGRTGK